MPKSQFSNDNKLTFTTQTDPVHAECRLYEYSHVEYAGGQTKREAAENLAVALTIEFVDRMKLINKFLGR